MRSVAEAGAGNPGVRIEVCGVVDDELVGAFARLHPQLSSSTPPDAAALERIVGHPANTVLIARDSADEIVGAMILVLFPLASGLRAWIEDVVVDEAARGRGIGAALNRHAIEIARQAGARTVDLTSRPDREAANRLYARLGFNQRNTNVYRLDL
ncbi:MAG: GNAT family N-acetyltransferase [Acidimicrobiales bacterium]|nr:GNAT family N-acetyltransferase [Acidimicrobiales bacterium]MYD81991.1 GNAT family N-acetyltransferase [Acidimicrobiales bacterium]MYJ64962.1 GNAT family N-acetyltransferase [Acidimicrobiales bacterium]